jgi:Chaperone of endosialidase
MEQPKHVSRRAGGVRMFSIAAVLVAALVTTGEVPPVDAQTNTALGTGALSSVTTGVNDTALGFNALNANTAGLENSATGAAALLSNTTGIDNTAAGFHALEFNTTGIDNTATGVASLVRNNADNNTATGFSALRFNTTGTQNTATGVNALLQNVDGSFNTATGLGALELNTSGSNNTATGINALLFNTADNNTGIGANALQSNTGGIGNTATGFDALMHNTTGTGNIALGFNAGTNLTTESNDIEIGNPGVAGDSGVIRIGTKGTATRTLIAGINNAPIFASSVPVVVNINGRLGFLASSARYKRDIRDMGEASGGLMKLRPVTFRYRGDLAGRLQYGLIAEEVARVYPELVTYGADGKVETVAYHLLPAMLLNEMQRQVRENQRKDARIAALERQLVAQQRRVSTLQRETARIDMLTARLNALEDQARTARPERMAAATR